MKAVTYSEYGAPDDVLALREIGTPDAGDGEVLVRVRAASLNPYDWHLMRGLPYVVRAVKGPTRPWKETVLGIHRCRSRL